MATHKTAWNAYIEYATTVTDDVHDQLFDQLAEYAGAPTTAPNGNFAVEITLPAPTVELAIPAALEIVGAALRAAHGSAPVAVIEVMSRAERNRRTHAPDIPELTGVPGVATILNISGAGARKRIASPEFQRHVPVAATIDGRPVFIADQVKRYAAQRSAGRPRTAAEQ
ncbi:hypothetical protein ACIF6L_34560 [Kitasatospora sp. NPDC086009]|uniref:hypothetical protein n=1 Tax=unclassified Kitasatospora TaxID=2633591 RepID=UPI0037C75CB9